MSELRSTRGLWRDFVLMALVTPPKALFEGVRPEVKQTARPRFAPAPSDLTRRQPLWERAVNESLRPSHRHGASFLDQKGREVADEVVFVLGADYQGRDHAIEEIRSAEQVTFRSAAFLVTAIFVAVFVLDTDFHAMAGSLFIVITPVVSASVRAVPASIVPIAPVFVSSAVLVAIPIIIVLVPSPVGTHFAVVPTHTVAVAATHPPVATHFAVVGPRLVAIGSLVSLLLGILVRNRLRRCDRRVSLLLGE